VRYRRVSGFYDPAMQRREHRFLFRQVKKVKDGFAQSTQEHILLCDRSGRRVGFFKTCQFKSWLHEGKKRLRHDDLVGYRGVSDFYDPAIRLLTLHAPKTTRTKNRAVNSGFVS